VTPFIWQTNTPAGKPAPGYRHRVVALFIIPFTAVMYFTRFIQNAQRNVVGLWQIKINRRIFRKWIGLILMQYKQGGRTIRVKAQGRL